MLYMRAVALLRAAGETHAADVLAAIAADPNLGDLRDDQWWEPAPDGDADADLLPVLAP